jgi:hypothetical protein
MFTCIASVGIIYLAGFALMAHAVKSSPEGFEDERGFSKGRPPLKEDPRTSR